MNNFSVAIIKTLLASLSTVTILLSALLISLSFNLWLQEGIPPFENLKFTAMLSFVVLFLLVICFCLKFHLSIAIDNREKSKLSKKNRVDDAAL